MDAKRSQPPANQGQHLDPGPDLHPAPVPPQAMTSTSPNGNGTRPVPAARPGQMPTALELIRRAEAGAPTPRVAQPTRPQLPELPGPTAPATPGLFSADQTAALAAPLNRAHVQTRSQAGRSLSYLEGWTSIRFRDTVGEPRPRRGHAQQQTCNDHQHLQSASRPASRRSGH
jgi:hypothetical protein